MRRGVAMRVERQLSIFLDNKPGTLAAACIDLAAHDVNIDAITIANLVDHAVVRMVVSDPAAAIHLLGEAGILVIVSDVLAVDLPDRAGAIAEMARTLGRAKINIDYLYGSSRGQGVPTIFLRVSDVAAAKRKLAPLLAREGRTAAAGAKARSSATRRARSGAAAPRDSRTSSTPAGRAHARRRGRSDRG